MRFCQATHSAKARGIAFDLTIEEYSAFRTLPCTYCGATPPVGIDRQDNESGYTTANCVPCCIVCNVAKHTQSVDDFRAWAERVARHWLKL